MDRPIIYSQEQGRSFDFLSSFKDYLKGGARLAQAIFGPTDTFVYGFGAAQKPVPNLSFTLGAGQIFQWAPIDSSPYGALSADTENVYQQGYAAQQDVTLSTAQLNAGQSQWVLIRARFKEQDDIRPGDPTGGVLPYYNSSNPLLPLQGVNGNGGIQNTVRKGLAEINVVYGPPAATGSETAPLPGAGYVGLYLINLTFGQTAITNGQILAAPAGIPGYPVAPFWAGIRAQHHKGTAFGQAPQIDLTQEVQGVLPLANCPASSTNGVLPTIRSGASVPTSLVGSVNDLYWQTGANVLWRCTVTGNPGTWMPNSIGLSIVEQTSFPLNLTGKLFAVCLCRPPSGNVDVNLDDVANMGGSFVIIKNDNALGTSFMVNVKAFAGQFIDGKSTVTLPPGAAVTLVVKASGWSVASGLLGIPFGGNGTRNAPTSGTIKGEYFHAGDWIQSGNITMEHGCRIRATGSIITNPAFTFTVNKGMKGGRGRGTGQQSGGHGFGPGGGQNNGYGPGVGGSNGGKSGAVLGGSDGSPKYSIDDFLGGSGGAAGGGHSYGVGAETTDGGDGGGGIYLEAGANISLNTINLDGGAAPTSLNNLGFGSGGGAGGSIDARALGTITVESGGTIFLRGGNANTSNSQGGSGGSGGNCRLWAGVAVVQNGTINVSPGTSGTGASASEAGNVEILSGVTPIPRRN